MTRDLQEWIELFACALPASEADVELSSGDIVLGQFPQSSEVAAIFWRCLVSGAIFVPIDPGWPAYLVERAAARMAPRVVIAEREGLDRLAAIFPRAVGLLLEPGVSARLGGVLGHPLSVSEPAAYLFTSGSTGTPKAVVHSRGSLAKSAALILKTFGWKRGERLLNLPELHTMSGLRNALVAAPIGGIQWIACRAAERGNFFDLLARIEESACDHLVAGPALVRQLAMFGDRVGDRIRSIQAIYCTGASLAHDASRAVFERFGIPVINYYGLTETGGICLSQQRGNWDPDDSSLGMPAGCEARLVAPDGSGSSEGELQVRSGQLMSGYFDDPEATARRFDGEWLRTGDIMRIDAAGRYHLRGRADLFIKTRSTERIHPEEIEQVLELHDSVAQAAVVGVPDPNGGERLVALAVLADGLIEDGRAVHILADFVASKLGDSRRLSEVRFVTDLPHLASGKLDRARLKELLI